MNEGMDGWVNGRLYDGDDCAFKVDTLTKFAFKM